MRVDQVGKRPDVRRPFRDGQGATPAPSGGVDPLAELARLVKQDEAFGAVVRNRGRSEQRAAWVHPDEPPASGHARQEIPSSRDWDADEDSPLVGARVTEPRDGPHDAYEYDGDEIDYSDDLPEPRRWLRVSAAIVGLALVGSASAFAYWAWFDQRVSVEQAQVTAVSAAPEKLLPPKEESRSDGRSATQASVGGGDGTVSGKEKPAEDTSAAAAQAPPPVGVSYGPAPTQVAALTPAAAPPDSLAAAPIEPTPSNEAASGPTAPSATSPGAENGSKYIVQLSSQRSEAAAQATSRGLQTKYAGLFGGLQPFILRSDLRERGVYYRVQVGPFSTIGEAKQLCGSLKKSGGDCVVQKN